MVRAAVFALLALFVAGICADYDTNITANSANGFDVIVLDEPSWATHIQRSWGTHEFFVFGERTLRTISSGPNLTDFFAEPITEDYGFWDFPLIDLHTTFYNALISGNNVTVRLTMGVAENVPGSPEYAGAVGAYTPLFSVTEYTGQRQQDGPKVQPTKVDSNNNTDFSGHLSYGLRVDPSNINNGDIVTYFAGYVLGTDSNNNPTLQFGLTRTHYNPSPNMGAGNRLYTYNASIDWFPFYSNQFTPFSSTFRPFVHFFPNFTGQGYTYVVVVDPNTQAVYGVNVDLYTPATGVVSIPLGAGMTDVDVVSNSIDERNSLLWVGVASSGFAPGYIYKVVITAAGPSAVSFTLPANYSNPKALANDGTYLYIGMNGYSEVLKMAYNGTIVGYQRLPDYLHRNWDATATFHHVYFITYEQNSKIYRVSKDDFCPAACPYNGYCKGGKCQCSHGYVMNSAKTDCLLQAATQVIAIKHHYTVAHDGEIVLGVFFALAVIVAAAGWFQWYKARRSAYQAV